MYVLRVEDAPEPGANETESSRFDRRVETAESTIDRILSFEEFRNELKDFEEKRRSEADDIDMVGAEDEPFNFNTVTEIIPREGYHLGTSDMEVENPKYQEDDEDHEGPRSARSANLRDSHHYPPSASGLPSQYDQYDQDTIINTYFEGVNQATPLFSELNYEDFHNHCREQGSTKNKWCAIYVMLALSLRTVPKNDYPGDDEKFISSACAYVDRHLYMLSIDIGLQIVLGIALYFMTTSNLQRAGFMHAIAVKLVYRLEYHKLFGETVKHV
ncbi:hypothetical protein FVER53263_20434 [Fusarium verticillioides]|nr:hypothetical protein FVER53263_20434 [Fusarium verticillioides]